MPTPCPPPSTSTSIWTSCSASCPRHCSLHSAPGYPATPPSRPTSCNGDSWKPPERSPPPSTRSPSASTAAPTHPCSAPPHYPTTSPCPGGETAPCATKSADPLAPNQLRGNPR